MDRPLLLGAYKVKLIMPLAQKLIINPHEECHGGFRSNLFKCLDGVENESSVSLKPVDQVPFCAIETVPKYESGSHERAIGRLTDVEADSQGLVRMFDAYAGNRLLSTSVKRSGTSELHPPAISRSFLGRTVS